jgi:hypothetical protein
MRGRLGDGKGNDDRYRPQTLGASLDLEVEPIANTVQVNVQHPETARPGSKIDLVVTLQDEKKKPLAGEVTLWLVDEAVLSLAPEGPLDPLSQFIVRNQRTTSVRDTRNLVVGRLQEQDEDPGAGGGEDEEGARKTKVVRKNFQVVPYYQATLEVGPSGKLTVPVKLSDDLTNFMVRAVAVSGMERFGHKVRRLHVRLPVIVQPQLPRFARAGDRFWAGGVGRLVEGAEGAGEVRIDVRGEAQAGPFSRKVELKRNRAESYLTPVTVRAGGAAKPGELSVRMDLTRLKDGAGDAFEVKLPLLPDRTVEQLAYFDRLRAGTAALKPFPEKPRTGTASQEVVVSSVPGVMELIAGLDYLAGYPHGCLEQKLSQLMPQMATGELLNKLGLNQAYTRQVGVQVKQLMGELELCQDDQGFLAYWPGGKGDVALTAQALEFISLARKLNLYVNEPVFTRASAALKRVLRSDFPGFLADYRYNQQASAARALTLAGAMDEHYLIDLYQHRTDLDLVSMADLARAMSLKPELFKKNLAALREDLWERVVFKLHNGKPVFTGMRWWRPNWGYGYLGSSTATLAAVLESLFILDPANPKLSQLRDGLIALASAGGGFGSTHDNQRAIQALVTYLLHAQQEQVQAKVTVPGDGTLALNREVKVARAEVKSGDPLKLKVETDAELGVKVRYSYLPETPGDAAVALGQGFIVERGAVVVHADGAPPTRFEDAAGSSQRIKLGDVLEIVVRLTSPEERYHVALVVPFAAGFEPLNPELKTAPAEARSSEPDTLAAAYVQRLDQEVRYYFVQLPKGTHTFRFRLKATGEGSFVHPSPWVEQMYHQEVRGRGAGMRLIVTGDHEK